jgi:hypothetical protein
MNQKLEEKKSIKNLLKIKFEFCHTGMGSGGEEEEEGAEDWWLQDQARLRHTW